MSASWLDLFSLPKMKDLVLPKVELLFASRFAADPDLRPRKDDCTHHSDLSITRDQRRFWHETDTGSLCSCVLRILSEYFEKTSAGASGMQCRALRHADCQALCP